MAMDFLLMLTFYMQCIKFVKVLGVGINKVPLKTWVLLIILLFPSYWRCERGILFFVEIEFPLAASCVWLYFVQIASD